MQRLYCQWKDYNDANPASLITVPTFLPFDGQVRCQIFFY